MRRYNGLDKLTCRTSAGGSRIGWNLVGSSSDPDWTAERSVSEREVGTSTVKMDDDGVKNLQTW